MFLHLLSKTKDCDVIEDAAIVVEVLNDLLHTSPRLFRFHGSRRNVVVANLKRKQPIALQNGRFTVTAISATVFPCVQWAAVTMCLAVKKVMIWICVYLIEFL